MVAGFLVLLLAGLCQGSFGLGYKKYPPFTWAAFWGVYCLLCIVVSAGVTWILAPGLWQVIASQEGGYWFLPLFCGALWGLSAIGFSKGISMIGMSMVYGISMGISTVVGSVLPMVVNRAFPQGSSLLAFLAELVLTVIGVVLVTIAGVRRDGGAGKAKFGVVLAVFSGLGSGAMNLGFSYSQRISDAFTALGYSQTAVSAGKWLPVLVGGCLAGALWCAGEMTKRREWKTLTEKGAAKRTGVLFGVSLIWYAALLLYGLSVSMLGNIGSTVGWILFNALALVISVGWGLKSGEWKDGGKNRQLLFAGCGVLILSWIFTVMV